MRFHLLAIEGAMVSGLVGETRWAYLSSVARRRDRDLGIGGDYGADEGRSADVYFVRPVEDEAHVPVEARVGLVPRSWFDVTSAESEVVAHDDGRSVDRRYMNVHAAVDRQRLEVVNAARKPDDTPVGGELSVVSWF